MTWLRPDGLQVSLQFMAWPDIGKRHGRTRRPNSSGCVTFYLLNYQMHESCHMATIRARRLPNPSQISPIRLQCYSTGWMVRGSLPKRGLGRSYIYGRNCGVENRSQPGLLICLFQFKVLAKFLPRLCILVTPSKFSKSPENHPSVLFSAALIFL